MTQILLVWLICLTFTMASLILPRPPRWLWAPRWAEGWLVPHAERQPVCRFQCGTCSGEATP